MDLYYFEREQCISSLRDFFIEDFEYLQDIEMSRSFEELLQEYLAWLAPWKVYKIYGNLKPCSLEKIKYKAKVLKNFSEEFYCPDIDEFYVDDIRLEKYSY